jgi:hypothetical protein
MENYFSQFSDKACCFEDLRSYVDLDVEAKSRWISFLASQGLSFVRIIFFLFGYAHVLSSSGNIGYRGGFAAGGQRAETTTDQSCGLGYIDRFRVVFGLQVY